MKKFLANIIDEATEKEVIIYCIFAVLAIAMATMMALCIIRWFIHAEFFERAIVYALVVGFIYIIVDTKMVETNYEEE